MDEREDVRQAINIVIDYCTNRVSCDGCAIQYFCAEVRRCGRRFSDCLGYIDKED